MCAAAVFIFCASTVSVAQGTLFPKTCLEAIGKAKELPETTHTLYVLVDETVGFDTNVVSRVTELVISWLKDGRAIEIIRFSAGMPGRYTEVVMEGRIDPEPSEEFLDEIRRSERMRFERCHSLQPIQSRKAVRVTLASLFERSDKGLPHSEIVSSIQEISVHIKRNKTSKKTVLIVSDMLENSEIAKFYSADGYVRTISVTDELARIRKTGLLSDMEGTRVYIFGLGYLPATKSQDRKYLGASGKKALVDFWLGYINESKGTVGEIGAPLMHGALE